MSRLAITLLAGIACGGCSSSHTSTLPSDAGRSGASPDGGVTPAPEGSPFETLSEWHLFQNLVRQLPSQRVVPYQVISQLFADYATKRRFIYVPAGETIGYSPTDKWAFPVGTILVKTFSYLADLRDPSKGETYLETRLLIHESVGWTPHTYVWNAAQTDATLEEGGTTIPSHFIDSSGTPTDNDYVVPNENDCRTCHGRLGSTNTIGGRTRQLDRDNDYGDGAENQIDHLAKLGFFDVAPNAEASRVRLVDPLGIAPLSDRARSYLEGNCAHCHQPGDSPGSLSGLWLDYDSTDPAIAVSATYGVCKVPASAGGGTCGRQFDVVPGQPGNSVFSCRMQATDAKTKMPPLGRNLVHEEGLAVIEGWIAALPGSCGSTEPDAGRPKDRGGAKDAGLGEGGAADAGRD